VVKRTTTRQSRDSNEGSSPRKLGRGTYPSLNTSNRIVGRKKLREHQGLLQKKRPGTYVRGCQTQRKNKKIRRKKIRGHHHSGRFVGENGVWKCTDKGIISIIKGFPGLADFTSSKLLLSPGPPRRLKPLRRSLVEKARSAKEKVGGCFFIL